MSLRKYIYLMIFATLICYISLVMVMYYFDPENPAGPSFILFYLSLGLSLVGSFSLIGLFARSVFGRERLIFKDVVTSFRQSFLFAILIVVALILKNLDLLLWWNILVLIGALAFLEIFLMSYKTRSN